MSEPASISVGIAERYATAIFDIAQETNALDGLETSLTDLSAAIDDSEDLRNMVASPLMSRSEQETAVLAVADKMGLDTILRNTLGVMAQKRRLFVVPQMITVLRDMIAEARGEVTAEVVSAKALTKGQSEKLSAALKERIGKDVTINATVDKDIIGGLIVKVGSKMIDTSIRSKLSSLQNAMKEVG